MAIDVPALQPTDAEAIGESVERSEEQHEFLFAENQTRQRRRLPPRLQYEGWQTTEVGLIDAPTRKIMFHSCYGKKHIAPQWILKFYQLDHMIENYECLSADERAKLLDTLYKNIKLHLAITRSNTEERTTKKVTDS